MARSRRIYAPQGSFDTEDPTDGTIQTGEWLEQNHRLASPQVKHYFRENTPAKEVQLEFRQYFQEEGEIAWQYKHV